MSEKLESIVVDAVANSNWKNLGEFPTMHFQSSMEDSRIITKQMNENQARGSARLNGVLDNLIIRQGKDIAELDMVEARAAGMAATHVDPMSQGHLLANSTSQTAAVTALAQILAKIAQTTVPQTGQQNTP